MIDRIRGDGNWKVYAINNTCSCMPQIAAHGNSLRALVKYLDNIEEDVITGLNIPTGERR